MSDVDDESEEVEEEVGEDHEHYICITIAVVTGKMWETWASTHDTVLMLKTRIWRDFGVHPCHQGLIYRGQALSDDSAQLWQLGMRTSCDLRLASVMRAGPLSYRAPIPPVPGFPSLPSQRHDVANGVDSERDDGVYYYGFLGSLYNTPPVRREWNANEPRPLFIRGGVFDHMPGGLYYKPPAEGGQTSKEASSSSSSGNVYKKHAIADEDLILNPDPTEEEIWGLGVSIPDAPDSKSHTLLDVSTSNHCFASAPEDTSAKESSAGDTECDEDNFAHCVTAHKFSDGIGVAPTKSAPRRSRASCPMKDEAGACCNGGSATASACAAGMAASLPRERFLAQMQPRSSSPPTDVHSEDGSDFSSGMVICDLSNDFRRLRVRRKHHETSGASRAMQKGRAKSKPRQLPLAFSHQHKAARPSGSDMTSSDDDRPRRHSENMPSCSTFRRSSAFCRVNKMGPGGYQSQQRCFTCAAKLTGLSVAFQCRCGKTLCARHRPPEMHTCTRVRKMQDVSD